jgi:thiol-disulfide isomerase/thioredoxin
LGRHSVGGAHTADCKRILTALVLVATLTASLSWASRPAAADTGHGVEVEGFPRTVLMELFTATWCGPCKLSDPAADAVLEEHAGRAELVRYHYEDALMTEETRSRAYDEYEVSGVPFMFVDGVKRKQGTSSQAEAYENYTALVDERMPLRSPVAILASGTTNATGTTASVLVVAATAVQGKSVRMQATLHESGIVEDGLMNDRVARALQNVTFTAAEVPYHAVFNFPANASWDADELGILFFVQDGVAGEVHQAAGSSLDDLDRPAVVIASHENGTTLTEDHSLLAGFAHSERGVQSVEVRVDGGPWEAANGTEGWTHALDVPALAEGSHTLDVRAFDGLNYSPSYSITVNVESSTAGPTIPAGGLLEASMLVFAAAIIITLSRRRRRD